MKTLIFSAILILSLQAKSQTIDIEKDTAAIEQKFIKGISNAQGIEIIPVYTDAISSYDKLLNTYYKKCLELIKPEDKKLFTETQRAWVLWKEKEIKLIELKNLPKYSGFSDMMIATNADEELQLIKKRVFDLYNYWHIFSSDFGKL